MREAVCRGWWIGAKTTPTPKRIRLVRWLTAANVMSGALLWDHSGRKWCSENHTLESTSTVREPRTLPSPWAYRVKIRARIVRSPGCDGRRRTSRWRILPLRRKCPSQTSARGSAYAAAKSYDENQTIIAHAPDPDLVGKHISQALGPNSYPTGSAVAASADQDGAWFDYTYPNPASGVVQTKHSWMVIHDGITFGSGWYERGPGKSDAPAYTKAFVRQAMNLYVALGLEDTVAYYNAKESIDGQWYVFIIDPDGYTIAHHNPQFRGRDPSLRVDATGYFYGDDLLSATEAGHWVDYVLLNPESGENR